MSATDTPAPPTPAGGDGAAPVQPPRSASGSSAWFSSNPDKAWVEKIFLAYSPVWMASMGVMMALGGHEELGNAWLLVHAFATAAPALVIPAVLHRRRSDVPWHRSYWLKANLYLVVFSFFGSYFGSEYFFDVLGMVYVFPNATTSLDSALVGSGEQVVPLIMYPLAYIYFVTYHATANIVLRRIRHAWTSRRGASGWSTWLILGVAVFAVGYFWAWVETKAMANPMMEDAFRYEKMATMLAYGSAIYATYFVASFPIWSLIDETPARRWSLLEVTAGALSASMLTMYLLDIAAHLVGTL